MRKALIVLLLTLVPSALFAYASPGAPTGFVNDFARVLSADQAQALEAKLSSLEKATGDEVVVVTVPSLGGDTVENYAVRLFQEWGIGKKNSDNGLLILVSTGDHEARIEVGYGLEGTVTDLQSGNIIRNVMIPAFKNGDYAGGIAGAVDAVTQIIIGSPDAAQYSAPQQDTAGSSNSESIFGTLFFFGFIILNALTRILGRTRSWWLGGVLGAGAGVVIGFIWGFFFIGIGAVIALTILGLIFDYIVSKHPPGPGRGGGLGGFWPLWFLGGRGRNGSGSDSGGFGGFGGGSSGGGGASGSW